MDGWMVISNLNEVSFICNCLSQRIYYKARFSWRCGIVFYYFSPSTIQEFYQINFNLRPIDEVKVDAKGAD